MTGASIETTLELWASSLRDLKGRRGLDQWVVDAMNSELASLAAGIGRNIEAVRAAITQPWSTSPVEGRINRLKTIKRQMYGRAGHQLLRSRLLAAA